MANKVHKMAVEEIKHFFWGEVCPLCGLVVPVGDLPDATEPDFDPRGIQRQHLSWHADEAGRDFPVGIHADDGFWAFCAHDVGPYLIEAHPTELAALRASNGGYGFVMFVQWGENLQAADDRRLGKVSA